MSSWILVSSLTFGLFQMYWRKHSSEETDQYSLKHLCMNFVWDIHEISWILSITAIALRLQTKSYFSGKFIWDTTITLMNIWKIKLMLWCWMNISGPRLLPPSSFLAPAVSSRKQDPWTVIQQTASEILQLQDSVRKLKWVYPLLPLHILMFIYITST